MLIRIKMHAIDVTGARDSLRVKKVACEACSYLRIGFGESRAFQVGATKLSAMLPRGLRICGGHTNKIGGTGIPGSMGALRISFTSVAIP